MLMFHHNTSNNETELRSTQGMTGRYKQRVVVEKRHDLPPIIHFVVRIEFISNFLLRFADISAKTRSVH